RDVYAVVCFLKGSATGNLEYAEKFIVTAGDDGVFNLVLGQGTYLSGPKSNLFDLDWSNHQFFLNIKIAVKPSIGSGGYDANWNPESSYIDIGTSQLWSVPYTFNSNKAKVAEGSMKLLTILPAEMGGTGVDNKGKTISLDKNLAIKGTGDLTISTQGASNITVPAYSGTMSTLEGKEILTNKTLVNPVFTNPSGLTKYNVQLDKVDNTSDLEKPLSTAAKSAISSITAELTKSMSNTGDNTNSINILTEKVKGNTSSITSEVARAKEEETKLNDKINSTTVSLTTDLNKESARAKDAEGLLRT
ncbi:MAG: hypothetical protein ACK42B_07745, partial [Chitinophagaceae bacterium]